MGSQTSYIHISVPIPKFATELAVGTVANFGIGTLATLLFECGFRSRKPLAEQSVPAAGQAQPLAQPWEILRVGLRVGAHWRRVQE
jgi:hypothetical protein